MLGTFPNDFSMLQLSMGMFPSGNFLKMQFPKRQLPESVVVLVLSPQHVLDAALGPLAHPSSSAQPPPHCSLRHLRGPNITFGKLPLGKLHIWEVATWDIVPWEVAL